MNLDPDTIANLQKLAPLFQMPAATAAVHEKDSFSSFVGGVRQNWIFIAAMISVLFWGFNQLSAIDTVNADQDRRITTSAQDLATLTNTMSEFIKTVDNKFDTQGDNMNEIIRRLDSLQKDVDIIKGDK